MARRRTADLASVFAGVAALALFLATASRDVAGTAGLDSAKFGYMSRILGVPHPPGYPLYLLLGWLFSWLPLGSLMFRMSALSAVFGAGTVCLVALILRRLGCPPVVAGLVAFLGAAGRVFWAQAVIPEVYTLHTLLLTGTLLALIVWKDAADDRPLYAASLCFGLDLAHHTDVAVFAPAILVFVVAVRPRTLASWRTVATCAALVLAPLLLYAYIVIRTRQGAEYVEARAMQFSDLPAIIAGRQFGYLLFRGSLLDAIRDRWQPLGRFVVQELGSGGALLALVGLPVLWRRDWRVALLIGLGAIGVLLFVFNYYPPDIEVFLLPLFLLAWIAIGTAIDAVWRSSRFVRVPIVAALGIWVAVQAGPNAFANNLRPESLDARLVNRLFDRMPPESAVVGDTIDVSQMLLYKIFSDPSVAAKHLTLVVPEEFGATRVFGFVRSTPEHPVVEGNPAAIDRLVAERPAVYVFARLAERMRARGFRLDPVRVPERPLGEYVRRLPRGSLVIAAAPGTVAQSVIGSDIKPFESIGSAGRPITNGQCLAIAGVVGGGRHVQESAGAVARVEVGRPAIDDSAEHVEKAEFVAECSSDSASIFVNGHEIALSPSAMVLAVVDAHGSVVDQTMAAAAMDYQVPIEWRSQPTYRIAGPRQCATVGSTRADLSPLASQAALTMSVPPGRRLTLELGSDEPLRPRPSSFDRGAAPVAVHSEGAAPSGLDGQAAHWTRIDVGPAPAGDEALVALVLGGQPRIASGTLDGSAPEASVCAGSLGNFDVLAGAIDGFERLLADGSRDELFAGGWHSEEQDSEGAFRWMAASDAHVLMPIGTPETVRIRVRARPASDEPNHATVAISVNGRRFEPHAMAPGWGTYDWTVNKDAWKTGTNDVTLHASSMTTIDTATRTVGYAVREIDVEQLRR
ncbi:MAG TPA: DUF2723 domain-containing protein [Vicinamibacterales bacterium]|jgi:hypothetical protein